MQVLPLLRWGCPASSEDLLQLSCGIKFHESVSPRVFTSISIPLSYVDCSYLDRDVAPKVHVYRAWSPGGFLERLCEL